MNNVVIRRLLYALKREWGTTFDYVQIVSSEANDITGSRTIKREVIRLPAVLLPQNMLRKFIQDIGYLAANKNFTYGGYNDLNTIALLVSRFDTPENFNVNLNGYVNYGHKRFEKVSIDNLFEEAYIIIARGTEGANPYAQIADRAFNTLQIQGRVVYELN